MRKNVKRIVGASLVGAFCFGLGTAMTLTNNVQVEAATADFEMKTGAAVRLATESAGLRFIAEMDESKYNEVIDSATGEYKAGMSLGMVIVPTAYVENAPEGTTDWLDYIGDKKKVVLDIPAEKVYEKDGSWCFNGVLTNIEFNSLDIDFIGIAYSYDGTDYDYADFTIANNSRNVALVASRALNDTTVTYNDTNKALLQDFITDTLYREAGVFAYEDGDTVLYYDSYAAYQADTERTNGSTDIQTVASSLSYVLEYIDVQDDAEFSLADGQITLTVNSAVADADYSNIIQWSSSNENVATVENGKVTAVSEGNATITATLFGEEYNTDVDVITAYVSNASEFANIANKANGHYVLTSDIDFGGATLTSLFAETEETLGDGNVSPTQASVGFLGTFDGRGYTLSNMTLSSSLFGAVGRTGVVKNVGFEVDKMTGAAVVAKYHYGVIDNVQLTVCATGADNTSTYAAYGLVVENVQGYSGAQYQYGVVSNVYVNASNLFYATWGERALVCRWDKGYYAKFSNIVVVASQFNETYLPIVKTKNTSSQYENNAAYISTAGLTAYDFSKTGFNNYWYIDENNVPTMKSKPTTVIAENYKVVLADQTDFEMEFAEEVKNITIGNTAISSYTVSDGKITIPYATLSTITPNDYRMFIETESKYYVADIAIISQIIMTAEDLTALQMEQDVTAYYVLGANITLTSAFNGITTGTFSGIFDGNGYTISGTVFQAGCGLLGATANNATVRNLAITNASFIDGTSAALASVFTGSTKIENVFISLNKPSGWANSNGVLAFKLESGATLELKNVITYLTDKWGDNTGTIVQWNTGAITGVNSYSGSNTGVLQVHTGTAATGVTNYTTLTAMQEAYTADGIDISWAKTFGFYQSLVDFLTK